MNVLFIARSNSAASGGGDMVQLNNTVAVLKKMGVHADIRLSHETIDYSPYDLLHFFNLCRPWEIIQHLKSGLPFIISPVPVDYTEYDKHYRTGLTGRMLRILPGAMTEYVKAVSRWILLREKPFFNSYLWRGHSRSMSRIMQQAGFVLPNSHTEYLSLRRQYPDKQYTVVPNGVDRNIFFNNNIHEKTGNLVICAARIEGRKNQLNLIKALNNTRFQVILIGAGAVNQKSYYRQCRKAAAGNIRFIDQLPQSALLQYYRQAKVHVLPSWFETCGLSSLEAAAMGCNIVITDKGYTRDYFGDHAFYCEPENPDSIRNAIEQAAAHENSGALCQIIREKYTWEKAARVTVSAYQQTLGRS